MSINELVFDGEDDFEIVQTERTGNKVEITVESRQSGSKCPGCHYRSKRVHSYYARDVLDLPMLDKETRLRLRVRKFYCINEQCQRKVFSERFERHFQFRKRMTTRVQDKIGKVALLMGGNGGNKLCRLMNLPVSSSTLIRSVHQTHVPEIGNLSAVGIDDWAYKKRLRYGTVVVDLVSRRIIDLLPDREAGTVKAWLEQHPEIEIVTRDRYINYATGVAGALPKAVQVADRWHLIKNLGDSVQRVLERCQGMLKQKAKLRYSQQQPFEQAIEINDATKRSQELLAKKQSLMDKVKELHRQGEGIRAISRLLMMSRGTVRKYLGQDVALPKKSVTKRNTAFEFEDYVMNAIATRPGVTAKSLYEEIKAMGYKMQKTVGHAIISKYIPKKERIIYPKEQPLLYWRPAEVCLFLYKNPHELRHRELTLLNYLRKESTEVDRAYSLFQSFRQMMEDRAGHKLTEWLPEAENTSIKELKSFAKGIRNDFAAVQNALSLSWSNGQVEGQINKLKTIKRQMYGRASFSLLRKRLICSPV